MGRVSLLGGRTGFLGGSTNRAELGRDVALERGSSRSESPGGDKEKDKIERRRRDSVTEGGDCRWMKMMGGGRERMEPVRIRSSQVTYNRGREVK